MGRTELSKERLTQIKKQYIGQIILFCEGVTEKYYFDYFADILVKNKYTDIHIVTESANGNARTVLNFAEDFLLEEKNNQKYINYMKYLVFDCDDPSDIEQVMCDTLSIDKKYNLLMTNLLFETWLLMHFENIYEEITKRKIYKRLSSHLHREYKKGRKGIVREIIKQGSVEAAIKNAYELEEKYKEINLKIPSNIKKMNPYTTIYNLVEQLMLEITDVSL
jgi:hypothetical protein